ncbi:helix-turn-helix domain-containing protein [Lachnospiraceae bacterium OttesenSCG-928-D06]|nr:helix-turn-helix domain-containing protein [Lachnospiraceae bacterium OttesenSCG-928-D06]
MNWEESSWHPHKIYHEQILNNKDVEVRFSYSFSEGNYVPPHWHEYMELIYVIEGKVSAKLPLGQQLIANTGEFFVINAGAIHSIVSEKNKALILQIPSILLARFLPSFRQLTFYVPTVLEEKLILEEKSVLEEKLSLEKKESKERIVTNFMSMYEVYKEKPEAYLLKFNSLLYDLLYELTQYFSEKEEEREGYKKEKDLEKIKEILVYIDQNHRRQISVGEIAEKFHYNGDYFSRYFKKHMNLSLTDYIYELRINYVYQELKTTEDSIQDILNRHCCSNYRVAMRHFRKRYGCTPQQVRKKMSESSY